MTLPKNEYHTKDQVLNLSEYCIKRWSDDDAEKDRIAFIFVNVDGSEEKWTSKIGNRMPWGVPRIIGHRGAGKTWKLHYPTR